MRSGEQKICDLLGECCLINQCELFTALKIGGDDLRDRLGRIGFSRAAREKVRQRDPHRLGISENGLDEERSRGGWCRCRCLRPGGDNRHYRAAAGQRAKSEQGDSFDHGYIIVKQPSRTLYASGMWRTLVRSRRVPLRVRSGNRLTRAMSQPAGIRENPSFKLWVRFDDSCPQLGFPLDLKYG